MSRFPILDHVLFSGSIYENLVENIGALHEVDNIYLTYIWPRAGSLILKLALDFKHIAIHSKCFTLHVYHGIRPTTFDLQPYKYLPTQNLLSITLPIDALLCNDVFGRNDNHLQAVSLLVSDVASAC